MRSVECRVQNASWCGAEGPEEANNVRQGSTALASISGAESTTYHSTAWLILVWCDSGLLVMREWVAQAGGQR